MFNLIPLSLLIGALGGILYIISGHLSEFDNEDDKNDTLGFNVRVRFTQYINQIPLDGIKNQSLSLTQKLLHRFRLALLKTDNHLTKLISKISQRDKISGLKNNENGNISDFWEKIANGSENPAIKNKSEERIVVPTAAQPEVKINFIDIKPAKISSETAKVISVKKSLKKKKFFPPARLAASLAESRREAPAKRAGQAGK